MQPHELHQQQKDDEEERSEKKPQKIPQQINVYALNYLQPRRFSETNINGNKSAADSNTHVASSPYSSTSIFPP